MTDTDPTALTALEARLAAVEAVQERMIDTLDTVTDMLNPNSHGSAGASADNASSQGEDAATLGRDILPGWVEWLRHTYTLQHIIRDTWEDQPALIGELEALRAGWVLSYGVDADTVPAIGEILSPPEGFDAFQWHDALARLIPRLAEHEGRFTKARHRGTR